MKKIIFYFTIISLIACSSPVKRGNEEKSIVQKDSIKKSDINLPVPSEALLLEEDSNVEINKLNIGNDILEEPFVGNEYFITYKDSILSACGFERLFYLEGLNGPSQIGLKFPHLLDSTYTQHEYGAITKYKVFYNSKTMIKWFNHSDTITMQTYCGISTDSYIEETNTAFNSIIQLGMTKDGFFKEFFTNVPDSIYSGTKIISICEDERADNFKNFYFNNDTLVRVDFKHIL